MQRLYLVLGGLAVVLAGAILALWSSSAPAPKAVPPPAPPTEASASPPAPHPAAPAATPPSFDIVKVDPAGHAVIAGRAAPGAKVALLDGDKKLGEVTADNRGEWVLLPAAPITPGERQLTLEATDPATGAKTKSADTVALAVAPPGAPGSSGTIAVLLPGNANEPARTLQSPDGRAGLSLDTAEYNDKGELMLSGHATPGATLRLYANNQPLGSVTADAGGRWSLVSPSPKGAGKADLRVDELAANGSVAHRIGQPFEPPTGKPPKGTYTVQTGNSLWLIARKAYGDGQHFTVIFSANKERIHDPNLIYPGQIITLPKS